MWRESGRFVFSSTNASVVAGATVGASVVASTAGVAPTDDSFTIIAPGPSDMDQDGPALVGDPDMGFSGLRHFGPNLVNHMRIKIRKDTSTSDFMMVGWRAIAAPLSLLRCSAPAPAAPPLLLLVILTPPSPPPLPRWTRPA